MRRTKPSLWEEFNMDDGIQLANRDRYYYEHRQRLNQIRSTVNMDTPRSFPKLQGNKVGTFTNEEYSEIQRNNKRLLKRLTNISYKKSRFSKIKQPRKASKSLNKTKKRAEMERIDRENRFLVSRIMNCKSTINHKKINKDWNRSRNIINNHQIAKRKRKSFRPNKLTPITLSNTSSSNSTPMSTSRGQYQPQNMNNINANLLENMSPETLQKLVSLRQNNGQYPFPLDTIIEKSDDMKSNTSTYRSYRDKYLHDAISQMNQLSINNNNIHQNNIGLSRNLNVNIENELKEQSQSESMTMSMSHNLMFSPYPNQNIQKTDQTELEDKEIEDKEEEKEETIPDEVLSDWEEDEEWIKNEKQQLIQRKKKAHKTITVGLPLI